MRSVLLCVCVILTAATTTSAQWAKQRDPRVPVSRDGKPNLTAPPPRASDGRPDLSGVWETNTVPLPDDVFAVEGPGYRVAPHFVNVTADMKPDQVQMEPWAAALFKERLQDPSLDPLAHCKPAGEPAQAEIPLPYKIVQTPTLVLVLYEENTIHRQIFLDGRKTVPDPEPRFYGYSTGRWDGDTLVVETTGFNDQKWLDRMGHPHTEALRVTERFRRPTVGTLEVVVTIEDPKAYRTPIVYTRKATLIPDEDLLEYFCTQNEKSAARYRK